MLCEEAVMAGIIITKNVAIRAMLLWSHCGGTLHS